MTICCLKYFPYFFLFLLLELPVMSSTTKPPKPENVVEYCESLGYCDYCDFVGHLGKDKSFSALEAIIRSTSNRLDKPFAVMAYASALSSDGVVGYCQQFQQNTACWQAAFSVLSLHKKDAVMNYIKQVAISPSPRVRAFCYMVCHRAGWKELLESAQKDIGNQTTLHDLVFGMTLGSVAKNYVDMCNQK